MPQSQPFYRINDAIQSNNLYIECLENSKTN